MAPAFVVVAMGVGATKALVVSQVILSLTLPVPMIALVILSSDKLIMGRFANGPLTRVLATASTGLILVLNAVLLYETFFGA
jgi:manganese transport protein